MVQSYRDHVKAAEDAVRSVKDKELRKEAFGIILLKLLADAKPGTPASAMMSPVPKRGRGRPRKIQPDKPIVYTPMKRPGRRGGGVATVAIQKLIDSGAFRTGRDAAGIMKELAKKRKIFLQPSQLRMVLLRFARTGKLKRKIKMKGDKVTYLYTAR